MRKVAITGIGIVSCLGNDISSVCDSLKNLKSGIKFKPTYKEAGLRSQIAGEVNIDLDEHIDRKQKRFMGDAAAYAYISMKKAIEDSGLDDEMVSNIKTGIIVGSGGGSPVNEIKAGDLLREKGIKRVGPYMVTKTMGSSTSACLATGFKIKGISYSVSSACSTSLHCIGTAAQSISSGDQDIMFAGGGEEESWQMSMLFDGMGALSTKYNETPELASRAYDSDRDGFVIGGGGGIVVLEELESAKKRGAKIYGILSGFGATSDGHDMVSPSGEGAIRCMKMAVGDKKIDYINTHGTSTKIGDSKEMMAIKSVFGSDIPDLSSTKSLTGHSLGATGVQETIYSLIMMQEEFLVASANIQNIDEEFKDFPILLKNKNKRIDRFLTNSFGFGGTNACLTIDRYIP